MATKAKSITLTDIQRAVRQAAARNAKLAAWPVPRKLGLSKGSATIVIKGLLKKGLIGERPALGNDPVWRESESGKPLIVLISKAGLAAIGIALDDVRRLSSAANPDVAGPAVRATQPRMPRTGTKLATLVGMPARDEGATVEMVAATGWQAHTVRGVMSGPPVKKLGRKSCRRKPGNAAEYTVLEMVCG